MKARSSLTRSSGNMGGGKEVGSYFVNVEVTSAFDEEGARFVKHKQVNTLSHCIFCLRRTTNANKETSSCQGLNSANNYQLEVVPKAESSCAPSTFNHTWSCIIKMNLNGNEDPVSILKSDEKKALNFLQLPVMCIVCAETMSIIDKLLRELKTQIGVLGKIVKESNCGGKYSWRAEQFERAIRTSELEDDVIDATINILQKLGGNNYTHGSFSQTQNVEPSVIKEPQLLLEFSSRIPQGCILGQGANELEPNSGNVSLARSEDGSDVGGFADEDDTWSGERDPDYCNKSEPDEDSSGSGDESWEEDKYLRQPPRTRSNTKGQSLHESRRSANNQTCSKSGKSAVRKKTKAKETSAEESQADQNKKQSICRTCGETFKNWRGLRNHKAEKHAGNGPSSSHECTECGIIYASRDSLLKHRRKAHAGPGPFQQCDLCKVTVHVRDIHQHVLAHVGDEYLTKCPNPKCPHVFSNTRALYHNHLNRNSSRAKNCKKFIPNWEEFSRTINTCEVCSYQGGNCTHVREHLLRTHENSTKNYSCPIDGCSEAFTFKQTVVCHLSLHSAPRHLAQRVHDETAKKVSEIPKPKDKRQNRKCHDCCAAYKSSSTLRDHQIREHGAEPYRCKICNETFLSYNLLLKHKRVHGPVPRVTCQVEGCGKTFERKSNLREHISCAHSGEKEHVCELCGKSYGRASGLMNHKNQFHLGLKPHVCETCGERFPVGQALRRHQRIHTGERPHACNICNQRFGYSSALKQHLQRHANKGADFKPSGPMKRPRKRPEKITLPAIE